MVVVVVVVVVIISVTDTVATQVSREGIFGTDVTVYVELELKFQLFHDSSRQQYGVTVTRCCSYSCFVLLKMGDSDTRNM